MDLFLLPPVTNTSSVSDYTMCLAFSTQKPRYKPAYELLDQFTRVEPVVVPKSTYECFLQIVFYTIVALVSLGCLGIIALSGEYDRAILEYLPTKIVFSVLSWKKKSLLKIKKEKLQPNKD